MRGGEAAGRGPADRRRQGVLAVGRGIRRRIYLDAGGCGPIWERAPSRGGDRRRGGGGHRRASGSRARRRRRDWRPARRSKGGLGRRPAAEDVRSSGRRPRGDRRSARGALRPRRRRRGVAAIGILRIGDFAALPSGRWPAAGCRGCAAAPRGVRRRRPADRADAAARRARGSRRSQSTRSPIEPLLFVLRGLLDRGVARRRASVFGAVALRFRLDVPGRGRTCRCGCRPDVGVGGAVRRRASILALLRASIEAGAAAPIAGSDALCRAARAGASRCSYRPARRPETRRDARAPAALVAPIAWACRGCPTGTVGAPRASVS